MPAKQMYSAYHQQNLTLRDTLALDRTLLAMERTVLAWMRTALTLFIAGLTLFHFAEGWLAWLGIGMVPIAAFIAAVGLRRYRAARSRLRMLLENTRAAQPMGLHPDDA